LAGLLAWRLGEKPPVLSRDGRQPSALIPRLRTFVAPLGLAFLSGKQPML
jgi:hypothetical protein